MDDERVKLSPADAIALLPDGEYIHTFRQAGPTLIGADWERNDMIKALNKYEAEVTGEQAQAMNHGMAFCDDYGWVFVETKKVSTDAN
ncbi:MAG: hypothetical protein ABFD25_00745 [Clostridiaceae bacterium]